MSNRLTDERLANICRAPWQDLDDVTNDEIVAMSDELKAARAQLAKMGPVYEAAVKMKETDEAYCELGEGVMATPKAVHDAVVDLYVAIDSALSTPTDAKEDGNGE